MTRLLRAPKPAAPKRGPDHYWKQVKRFGRAGFTVNDLFETTKGVTRSTVKGYVQILHSLGAVEPIGTARGDDPQAREAVRYACAMPHLVDAPSGRRGTVERRRGAVQESLWRTMRLLDGFSMDELAVTASTEEVPVGITTTRFYVGALIKAGLVVTMKPVAPVRGFRAGFTAASLRLLPSANTGPLPPRIVGSRVFDPNQRAYVGSSLDDNEVSA